MCFPVCFDFVLKLLVPVHIFTTYHTYKFKETSKQIRVDLIKSRLIEKDIIKFEMLFSTPIITVSYTHLDVYKRQYYTGIRDTGCSFL